MKRSDFESNGEDADETGGRPRQRVIKKRRLTEDEGSGSRGQARASGSASYSGRDVNMSIGREGNTQDLEDSDADESNDELDSEAEADRLKLLEFPDDVENVKAYHKARARRERHTGVPAECGVIKSVTLIDFMNHKHTTVDFGPRLNFLVGHNGSGKSAILTAVSIALGSKAASTGRGSGLKELVRKGAEKAVIILTMLNKGPDAYKPDIYSPNIIIERHIGVNGTSAYKFRATRDGRILNTKREELQAMVQCFGIVIDSPLTVLTQDAARSFLQNANDAQLYKFFLEGSQLQSLSDSYDKQKQMIGQTQHIIDLQKEQLPDMIIRIERLTQQVAASEKVMEKKLRSHQIDKELTWAGVVAKEKERDDYVDIVAEQEEKVTDIGVELEKAKLKMEPIETAFHDMQEEMKDYDNQSVPLKKDLKKAKDRMATARRMLNEQQSELRSKASVIREREEDIARLNRKIEEKRRLQDAEETPEQAKTKADIRKIEELVNSLKRELPIREADVNDKLSAAQQAEEEENRIRGDFFQAEEGIKRTTEALNGLRSQMNNRLLAFGQGIDQVLKDIDRARWRHSKPIGPLGMHVQLLDWDYKELISALLGNLMNAFAVRCSEDRQTLFQILDNAVKSKQPPQIIQHSGDQFNFSSGDNRRYYPETVLSKVEVDHPDVLRILIVQAKIEQVFVCRQEDQANALLDRLNAQGLLRGDIASADKRRTVGGQASRNSAPIHHWDGRPMFSENVGQEIHEREQDLETQKRYKQQISDQLFQATQAKNQAKAALADARRAFEKVRRGLPTAQDRMIQLKDKVEERPEDEVAGLEENKATLEQELLSYTKQLPTVQKELQEMEESLEKVRADVAGYQTRVDEFEPERRKKEKAIQELGTARHKVSAGIEHWTKGMARNQATLEGMLAQQAKLEAEAVSYAEEATVKCARVEVTASSKALTAEKATLDKAIKNFEKDGGKDVEEMQRTLGVELKRRDEIQKHVKDLGDLCTVLHKENKKRQVWWMEQRAHIAVRARTMFIVHLQKRSFEGRLDFDHSAGRLKVLVQTAGSKADETQESSTQARFKAPKNLSGGERSYSTVALLLAMWDTAAGPIRCLDEWDVFLDQSNRALAGSMLIDGARESDGRQYVLITPQTMSNVPTGGDCKIIRLSDPERNQATLNFAPVA